MTGWLRLGAEGTCTWCMTGESWSERGGRVRVVKDEGVAREAERKTRGGRVRSDERSDKLTRTRTLYDIQR